MIGEIYRPLYLNQAPMMFTGRRTAELIKYAANAFLATKITFINEIADLCRARRRRRPGRCARHRSRQPHRLKIPACRARLWRLVLSEGHPRAGQDRAGSRRAAAHRRAVVTVNDNRKRAMARKVANALGGNLRGKTIAVLGLTFKPNTDDMREAPSIPLITGAAAIWAQKCAPTTPSAWSRRSSELPDIDYCDDAYACADGADALVIVTEWDAVPRARPAAAETHYEATDDGRSAQYLSF